MDLASDLMVKYGDAFLVTRWENQEITDYHWDPLAVTDDKTGTVTGGYVEEKRDLYDHPVTYVVHGKNVYLSVEETDVQKAKYVGVDEYYDPAVVELFIKQEIWSKKQGNEILEFHGQKKAEEKRKKDDERNYYNMREDGSFSSDEYGGKNDRLDRQRRQEASQHEGDDFTRTAIKLVRVYAREDLNKDGFEEEVEFLIHLETRTIPFIKYLDLWHGMRPITQLPFQRRDGVGYSIGVAEMLFNLQRITNQLVRDHLNNNMVQNTKAFLARAGGPVKDQMRVYPGKIIFVQDMERDFKPIDMGTGRPVDVTNVLPLINGWAERRTGVNDATLGKQSSKRAPATSTLALIEQANQVTTHIIARMGRRLEKYWKQIQALYVQFHTDEEELAEVLGPSRAQILKTAWSAMDPRSVRKTMLVKSNISSAAMNQQTRRQEAVALFGQIQMAYETINKTVFLMIQIPDPMIQQLLMTQLQGFNRALGRIYDTFGIKDQAFFNPDFLRILQSANPIGTPPVAAGNDGGVGGQGPRDQMGQAQQLFGELGGGQGPEAPPGRPAQGADRNPAETLPGAGA
jgi:hypothetical protein